MDWHGPEYVAEMERTVGQRVQAVGYVGVSEIREMISIPSRTVTYANITKGKNKGKRKKVLGARGSNRSKPGNPPHKDFGTLRQSIAQDYDATTLTVRIGSALAVAKYLELGTAKMAPRPFLRRWLAENRTKIEDMIRYGPSSDIR